MNAERRTPQLFLYGSLLTGTPNRRLNKQMRRLLRRAPVAMIRARLYNLGRYPGVVPSTVATDRVYGRVIGVGNPRLLAQLDRYEEYRADDPTGDEFVRIMMPVQLRPSGKTVDCWVYIYNREVSGKQRIASGDYVRFLRDRRNGNSLLWLDMICGNRLDPPSFQTKPYTPHEWCGETYP